MAMFLVFFVLLELAAATAEPAFPPLVCGAFNGCQCGAKPKSRLVKRVIGGSQTEENDWPWLVRLSTIKPCEDDPEELCEHTCGAALLSVSPKLKASDIVLTARHCHPNKTGLNARLYFGDYNISVTEETEEMVKVAEAIAPPYIPEGHGGIDSTYFEEEGRTVPVGLADIAILRLERPINFTKAIQPICLPPSGKNPKTNRTVYFAGWGLYNEDATQPAEAIKPEVPYEIMMHYMPDDKCRKYWPHFNETAEFCAKIGTDMEGGCKGDSGSPLVYRTWSNSRRFTLAGVASHVASNTRNISGEIQKRCNVGGRPSLFTRVSTFVDWIQSAICEKSVFKGQLKYCGKQ